MLNEVGSLLGEALQLGAVEAGAGSAVLLVHDAGRDTWQVVATRGTFQLTSLVLRLARQVASSEIAWAFTMPEPPSEGSGPGPAPGSPLIAVPVRNRGQVLAVLEARLTPDNSLSFARRLQVLQQTAELVGSLLHMAQLRQEVQEKEKRVGDLLRATVDAQEAEREHICLELHDSVSQTLASAFYYLQALEVTPGVQLPQAEGLLLKALALVKQAIQEARALINSMTPATLAEVGLVSTLHRELGQLAKDTGWRVEFRAGQMRLPDSVEIALYRIIHEALANIRKHSQSQRVYIELTQEGNQLKALVKDWGIGFAPDLLGQGVASRGTGLRSMRRRAELLGGTLAIRSSPGWGTEVRLDIPLSLGGGNHGDYQGALSGRPSRRSGGVEDYPSN